MAVEIVGTALVALLVNKMAEKMGENVGDVLSQGLGGVISSFLGKHKRDGALEDLKANPEDEDARQELAHNIDTVLKKDEEFRQELESNLSPDDIAYLRVHVQEIEEADFNTVAGGQTDAAIGKIGKATFTTGKK